MRYLLAASARLVPAILVLVLAVPELAAEQVRSRNGGDDTGRGRAIPRSEARAPAPAPAATPASEPAPVPRRPSAATAAGAQATPRTTGRQRENTATVRTAVPRGSVPGSPRNGPPVVVPAYYGGYWPWGFGGFGYGSYYGGFYGGFYFPYARWHVGYGYPYGAYGYPYGAYGYPYSAYGYPYGGYGYPAAVYNYPGDGELRLKVKPREAQVFVDGYYVGIVDDFDGAFQRLHLALGSHRIELRAPGYETLTLDIQIRFNDTTKFEGELRRIG